LTLSYAIAAVAAAALFGNRIVAAAVGVWFRVPPAGLLTELILLDVIQIPFFYWLYDNSEWVLAKLPERVARFFKRDPETRAIGRWTARLGHVGVGLLAALPTLGGGMWSAVFLAYGLKLNRRVSYLSLILGSALSYFAIYWIVDTLIAAVRYFGTPS
jgi:uncharacterized membrane protein